MIQIQNIFVLFGPAEGNRTIYLFSNAKHEILVDYRCSLSGLSFDGRREHCGWTFWCPQIPRKHTYSHTHTKEHTHWANNEEACRTFTIIMAEQRKSGYMSLSV